MSNQPNAPENRWFPIASSTDLVLRHVFHGQLLGREFAVWRADDGNVNVWENRCLHRGVRLSIGINDGAELQCQYHGWRYANRTAGCTYIPAHPADAPAQTICNQTYPAVERYGMVWSAESPSGDLPNVDALDGSECVALRPIPVNAAAQLTEEHLNSYNAGELPQPVFFVQPVDSSRCVIRGVLAQAPKTADIITVLREHNDNLSALRDVIEANARDLPAVEPMRPVVAPSNPDQPDVLAPITTGRAAPLRVQVTRKWQTARDVVGIELVSIAEQLPTPQPGAHIDVHLPNGLVRQYSITNGPGQTGQYTIGVKLEADSAGGSACLHNQVREGDVLAISEPRHNFPLRRDAVQTLLIAGGIGITPLLSMSQALNRSALAYTLHTFCQSADHEAFKSVLEQQKEHWVSHTGLNPEQTSEALNTILATYQPATQVYICGPGPMLESARKIAKENSWPDEAVHFEYFKNSNTVDDSSSFEISLARSALTLPVPAGKSILQVLRENGINMPSSCEQGACGTCMLNVLEGEPDHQDVYLNESEKRRGNCMMTCVSRARSNRLVLDV